jgi:hypothetical protein
MLCGEGIYNIETDIMARMIIFGAYVTQTGYQEFLHTKFQSWQSYQFDPYPNPNRAIHKKTPEGSGVLDIMVAVPSIFWPQVPVQLPEPLQVPLPPLRVLQIPRS